MENNKIITIFKCFTKEEFKSFEKFIISPYFSTGRDVYGLFSVLKKYYPEFNNVNLEKERVFTNLFPGQPYNEKKLVNLSSNLTKMAEQFLIHDSLRSNNIESVKTLARVYKNKNNEKLFLNALNSLESKILGKHFSSITCFDEEENLERLKEEYFIGKNRFDKSVPIRIEYTEYFTLTFIISFLRKLRDKAVITAFYNMSFESPLINSVFESFNFDRLIELLKEKNYSELWLIEIYYYAFKCMYDLKDETYYRNFKRLFSGNINKFTRQEKYFIFNDFIAYSNHKETMEGKGMAEEELEIYKIMLEENSYSPSENEYLSIVLYRNIMMAAVALKEHKWLRSFIENYTPKLKPEYAENMANLAKATLSFETGNFDEALKYIGKVQYDFFLYKLDVKNLMLKIYYELDLFDAAFSLVDAYKHYLSGTDEISGIYKAQYNNFVNFYYKILKAKTSGKVLDHDFEIKEMDNIDNVASRKWLKEKINKLKQKGA